MTKIVIGVGVLVIIGLGLWWGGVLDTLMPKPAPAMQEQATTTPQQQTQQQPTATNDLPTQPNDASDGAMLQDTAAVDAQMQSLGSDSSNVDSSLNDKQVTQEF